MDKPKLPREAIENLFKVVGTDDLDKIRQRMDQMYNSDALYTIVLLLLVTKLRDIPGYPLTGHLRLATCIIEVLMSSAPHPFMKDWIREKVNQTLEK